MLNCSYCKVILKKSQANEGLKDPKCGLSASPSSSFSPLFKSPGAGVTDSPGSIASAIFIPLLIVIPVPPAPGEIIIRKCCGMISLDGSRNLVDRRRCLWEKVFKDFLGRKNY